MANGTNSTFVHNGMKIELVEGGAPAPAAMAEISHKAPTVTIDGEPVPVWVDPMSAKIFATKHSPHMSFDSLSDLAIHVADYVIAKRATRGNQ